jgi:hypothetical protein
MDKLLDKYHDKQILAIITGHDHVFSAFKRKNTYILSCGSGGGVKDSIYSETMMGKGRKWDDEELHGPLSPECGKRCLGYELHLDSWRLFTRTEVELDNKTVKFTVRNLDTW